MVRNLARSSLYRLIAAGRRAHAAVLAPLEDRGLPAGDDAVVLLLGDGPLGLAELAAGAGVPAETLAPRVARLAARGYVHLAAGGDAFALTPPGHRLHAALLDAWHHEEAALTGSHKRHAKALRKALRRYLHRP